MAVEAARDCFGEDERTGIDTLTFASTTAPFLDRQNAVIVKEALNLEDSVRTADAAGGQRAGLASLIDALEAGRGRHLCVAADKRLARPGSEAELTNGDAAAAFLVGEGEAAIARFIASHSLSTDFVDHFRKQGFRFDYDWEGRWIREEGYGGIAGDAVGQALAKAGMTGAQVDRFIFPAAMRGAAASVAKQAGVRLEAVQDDLLLTVGLSGAAHPLLMLAVALETAAAGEVILVAGFGQGCDVLILQATGVSRSAIRGPAASLANRRAETNYMQFLFFNNLLEMDRGMRAEQDQKTFLTAAYRNRKTVLGLVGGQCRETGAIQFPKTRISVNPNGRFIDTQVDYPLAERRAAVLTYTADRLGYTPDPPGFFGMVEFEGGGRMNVDFTDASEDDVEVGKPMRMVFRIKGVDEVRGFTRYFWKAAPAL
ncbi:OB-fold domain-containing protein [Brevundimonas sp.]|uniref:OB-fold domain-containing protein n=1 Tax=Brevundimonas sp. TaxID=1871086 RepID=UPI00289B838A|nr:OB-fold domain-containing protein [Brevundimonas sp.]